MGLKDPEESSRSAEEKVRFGIFITYFNCENPLHGQHFFLNFHFICLIKVDLQAPNYSSDWHRLTEMQPRYHNAHMLTEDVFF